MVVFICKYIPQDEGLAAIKAALEKREDKSISTDSLMDLAQCVLKNNLFEHNSRYFKQKQGTAIGTKMAQPYAILFMDALEQQFLQSSPLKPLIWWRYIDDIFFIWQHGEDKLKEFLGLLNSCHPTIKFTYEYSSNKINFLDVVVMRHGDKIVTDLYAKPTDTHQYIEASSCHVFHCKKAIPYSQTLRLNRICSEGIFFDRRCNELEQWLKARGYRDGLVREQILRARKFKRDDLLGRKPREATGNKLTFNITYHPAFARIKGTLSKIHLLLTPNEETPQRFPCSSYNRVSGEVRASKTCSFVLSYQKLTSNMVALVGVTGNDAVFVTLYRRLALFLIRIYRVNTPSKEDV